jgi:hypothetical protein
VSRCAMSGHDATILTDVAIRRHRSSRESWGTSVFTISRVPDCSHVSSTDPGDGPAGSEPGMARSPDDAPSHRSQRVDFSQKNVETETDFDPAYVVASLRHPTDHFRPTRDNG